MSTQDDVRVWTPNHIQHHEKEETDKLLDIPPEEYHHSRLYKKQKGAGDEEDNSKGRDQFSNWTWWEIYGRWHVLGVFSLLSFVQCLVWFTFSSAPNEVMAYYGKNQVSQATIDLMLNWGPIVFLPSLVVVTWIQTLKFGMRLAFWGGALLTFAAAVIRTIPCWLPTDLRLHSSHSWVILFLHAGQILNAMTGACVMALCSKLSVIWFPDNQRATATSISYILNSGGTAVGFLLGPAVAKGDNGIPNLLYIHIAAAALPLIGGLIYFPEKPKRPPSEIALAYSQGLHDNVGFFSGLWQALLNVSFLLVIVSGALICGVGSAWQGVLQPILSPPYSDSEAGYLGFATVVGTVAGGLIAGPVADRYFRRRFKLFLLLIYVCAILSFTWFTLSLPTPFSGALIPSNYIVLMISITVAGLFQGAAGPISYELCAELVYPVHESTSGGLFVALYNIASIVLLFVSPEVDSTWMNPAMTGTAIACLLLMLLVREHYRRSDAEALLKEEKRGGINASSEEYCESQVIHGLGTQSINTTVL